MRLLVRRSAPASNPMRCWPASMADSTSSACGGQSSRLVRGIATDGYFTTGTFAACGLAVFVAGPLTGALAAGFFEFCVVRDTAMVCSRLQPDIPPARSPRPMAAEQGDRLDLLFI